MSFDDKELFAKNDTQQQATKHYTTPQLTVHGTVEEITEAIAGAVTDGLIGSQIK